MALATPHTLEQNYPPLKANEGRKVNDIWDIYTQLDKRWWRFRKKMARNFNYVANEQIEPSVEAMLRKQRRPILIDNMLHPLVTYVSGLVAQSKTKVRALPRRNGDQNKAELHTVLGNWAMDGCDGYYEFGKASTDALIGGIGWVNLRWDFKLDPEGKPIIEEFDPFMVMFDPDARKEDQSDWRYYTVSAWYGVDEILAIYNGIDEDTARIMKKRANQLEGIYREGIGKPVGWEERIMAGMLDNWRSDRPEGWKESRNLLDDMTDARDGLYRVVEFHDRRTKTTIDLYDSNTRKSERIPDRYASVPDSLTGKARVSRQRDNESYINAQMAKMGSPIKRISQGDELWTTGICPALLPEKVMLEQADVVQGRGFQHKPIFAYDYHPDITRTQSLIDNLISSQDSHNQRRMTQLELLMDTVNASYVAANGSILPKDLDAWQSRERGPIKFYNPVSGNPPQREFPAPGAIQGLGQFASEDADIFPMLSGVPPNAMGFQQSSREGAMLYNQRVSAGLTVLQVILTHLNRTLEGTFSYVDRLIQHFMKIQRAVRLLGEPPEGMEGVEVDQQQMDLAWLQVNKQTLYGVMNDVSEGEYDFKPDPAKLGETTRRQLWYELVELWKIVPEERRDWAVFFDAWDNPIGKKLAKKSRMVDKQVAVLGAQQREIQTAGATAQIGEKHALAQKKLADARAKDVQSKIKAVNDAVDIAQKLFPVNAGVSE